jgi:hypothetical protein
MRQFPILFFLLCVACQHPILDNSERTACASPIKDTGVLESALPYQFSSVADDYTDDLKLYTLKCGFDSFQLRVWYDNGDFKGDSAMHLLIFKKAKGRNWEVKLVNFSYTVYGGVVFGDEPPKKVATQDLSMPTSLRTVLENPEYFARLFPDSIGLLDCRSRQSWLCSSNSLVFELGTNSRYVGVEVPRPSCFADTCSDRQRLLILDFLLLLNESFKLSFFKNYI